ncbi:AsmA family protein [Pontibacter sp. JH31]|uniref:AsmA family protein n=1 Tax=Pontibacter aquaedesilientis TaxID=2766980 RepID=A0ABR7XGK5_9BACT|nr:AsmA-like C-terminal region-containing protein [Pontibacter aquaedesilientis]MBD1397420.1 AsmA family protein [Pontibacter aquaedesilientis]
MKKVVIGFFIFLVVLLAAAALVPLLFKDKIKQALDKEIAKNINATVIYETDDVSLSLFRDFPNMSLGVEDLMVVGQDSFATDTLAIIPSFRMGLDLMSVIGGSQLKINNIKLENPTIRLLVLKSGKANWDIFIPDTATTVDADTAASDFRMAIKNWDINNGTLFYDDLSIPFGLAAYNVQHTGSGDFEKSVFDMKSRTQADRFVMTYGGANYIENAVLDADVTMAMDLDRYLYTFKDNNIKINELPFQFAGTILMPEDDIVMDLTFKATNTDFRSVLSVVPGMYKDDFKDIKTEGTLSFDGYLKGRMNDTLMPGFGTTLKVTEGMFKYPDLPQAARNISVDMRIDNPDGDLEKTVIDVRKFHMDMGKNPIDARVLVKGMEVMQVDGNLKASIDLDEVTKVFPVEDMTLRGLLKVDADAKGTYSEKSMPVIDADMRLTNGYVKSKDFPAPIQNLNMVTNILNKTGNTDDTRINVERFNMTLDGEPLEGRVLVQGIESPAFDGQIKGILDLTKLTKIFPLEDMTVSGRINANVAAKGKMSDVEAERYNNVTANGTMGITNLNFVSKDMPQGMKITSADAVFNNERIQLNNLRGFLGKSDIQASGTLSNYLGYALADNQSLRGNFTLNSNNFNVNEWMVDENTGQATTATSEAEGVVEVPDNLDITLNVNAKQVLYDDLKLSNVGGRVLIKDKTARLDGVKFNTLGGTFVTSGSYNTKDLKHPLFDMKLDVQNLSFKEAFNAFNTIKAVAPIAGLLDGTFSTNFNLAGEIGQDMTPLFSTLDGSGIVNVVKAAVRDVKIIDQISALTRFDELKTFVIENKKIDAQIIDGSLVIKPFDLKVGDIEMTVGGSNNVNGNIDYVTALNVPAGKVGRELNTRLGSLIGNEALKTSDRITLNLNIGGTLADPRVALAGGSAKGQAKQLVESVVKSKVDEAKLQLEQRKQQLQDSVKNELDRKRQEAENKARLELEKKRQDAEKQIKKQATDKIGDLLRPKPVTQPTDTTKKVN